MSIVLPGLPEMALTLAASEAAVQLSLSACVIGLAVGQLLSGPVSDAIGRRVPLLVGLSVWTVTTALCAIAPSAGVMIALRFVQGLTGGVGMALGRAIVRDLTTGDDLIRQYARLGMVSGVAPIISPLLGTAVMLLAPWQGIFVFLAAGGVAMVSFVIWGFGESLPPDRRRPPGVAGLVADYGALTRSRTFLGPVFVVAFGYAAMFSYVLSSSFIYREAYDVSAALFSLLFGINGAGFAVAAQLGGRLAVRHGIRRVVLCALPVTFAACGASALLWATDVRTWPALAVPLFVMVASLGLIMTLGTTWAMRSQPERAGTASGMLGLVQFAVGGTVAPIVGIFSSATPLALSAVTTACVLAVAVAALLARIRPTGPA